MTIAAQMRVMELPAPGQALEQRLRPLPEPAAGEVLIEVAACAVCRTDLHVVDGDLPPAKLPIVPGHEIVGRVRSLGAGVDRFRLGERVGVAWLGWACGACEACRRGEENLCPDARFTGYQIDGGFADYTLADARFCFSLGETPDDAHVAPWLCAGLIGYRALTKAGEGERLGLYGFGAAAHIVVQVARHQGRRVFAFTRPGDEAAQAFARRMGCVWAGASDVLPPEPLDAAILFAPVGALVPAALAAVRPGGTVVCGGIHMSDIPSFPYALLWQERRLVSVANLTRRDGADFLALAPRVPIRTEVEVFALDRANEALARLRDGRLSGAAVLMPRLDTDNAATP